MKYLSLFSGIEAATVAWHPLGWECVGVSEIEPFPCAVLAHHYPEVPNLGDVTKITEDDIKALGHIDIVVFGSPCQDLSVAGLRKGFTCESTDTLTRSGLFFIAMRIVSWARKHCGCRFALWENVPGAFSSSQGMDFAAVVGTMAGLEDVPVPPKGWGNEGVAVGSEGLVEWATLDAQWFGVAQRRRRVFALLDTGDWAGRPPILLEPESLRGDSAPSRETGEETSSAALRGIDVSCTGTLTAGFGKIGAPEIDAYTAIPWPAQIAATLNAAFGEKQGLEDQHINQGAPSFVPVTHSLRGEGFDASEDGTGRRTPLVPVAFHPTQDHISSTDGSTHAMGCGSKGGCSTVAIAFSSKDYGNDATTDLSPTLRSLGAYNANGGGNMAVAVSLRGREGGCSTVAVALQATYGIPGNWIGRKPENGGNAVQPMYDIAPNLTSSDRHGVAQSTQVRRLTPVECERLQGFPDNYTDIKPKGKPTPDGPRYKALGNSMAVPVMAWIGRQIEEVIK